MLVLVQYAYAFIKLFMSSTLLPSLLTSLSQQKHSPNTATNILTEYDYIVVGAGSGGSVVASRLSEMPCVNILLLEAGKPPPLLTEVPGLARFFWFTDIDWKYRTAPQKYTGNGLIGRQVVWPSGKTLGGSSTLNGMFYVRGNRKNYDRWAAEGADGWSYKDVLPYFIKMEDNRDPEYVANGFHGVHGPQTVHRPRYQAEFKDPAIQTIRDMGYRIVDPNAYRQTGFYDTQSNMRAGQRCSTAKAYLVPAENRTNLDILPNAMVRKVLIQDRRAVGVQFDYQGQTIEVRARREVIMSAGTTNTAQLLMLSGVGPKEELNKFGIPVIADLPVGKNMQDHAGTFVPFTLPLSVQRISEKIVNPRNVKQYIQNRTGPLASSEFISLLAFLQNNAIAPITDDLPDHQLYFVEIISEISYQLGMTLKYFLQVMAPYLGRPVLGCVAHLLNPRSRGTVTLQSTNPYDPPVIDPNYFEDPRDIQDVVEGLKACKRIGNHPIMRKFGVNPFKTLVPGCERFAGNDDLYFTCSVRSLVVTFSHQVGTARMGHPEDPRTVVDPQLRVLHIKGLRVVDASVMPIVPSGNTNVPTIMVAEKASDIIKSTIECYRDPEDQFKEMEEPEWYNKPQYYQEMPDSFPQGMRQQFGNKEMLSIKSGKNPEANSATDLRQPSMNLENSELFDSQWSDVEPKVVPWNMEDSKSFEGIRPFATNLARNQTLLDNEKSLIDFREQVPTINPRTLQSKKILYIKKKDKEMLNPKSDQSQSLLRVVKRKIDLNGTRSNNQDPEKQRRFQSNKVSKLPVTKLGKKNIEKDIKQEISSKTNKNSENQDNQFSHRNAESIPLNEDLNNKKYIQATTQTGKEGISSVSDTVPWNQVIQLSTLAELTDALKILAANESGDSLLESEQVQKRSERYRKQENQESNVPNQRTIDQTMTNNLPVLKHKDIEDYANKAKLTGRNAELVKKEVGKLDNSKQIPTPPNNRQRILLEVPHGITNLKNTQNSQPIHSQGNNERTDPENMNIPSKNGVWNGNILISVPWNEEIQELNSSTISFQNSQNRNMPQSQIATKRQLTSQNWQVPMKKTTNKPWNAELINNMPVRSTLLNAKQILRPGALGKNTRALFSSKFSNTQQQMSRPQLAVNLRNKLNAKNILRPGALGKNTRALFSSKFSNTQQQVSRPQLAVNHKNPLVSQAKLKTRPWNAELVNGK